MRSLAAGASVPIITVTSGAPLNLTVNGNPSNSSGTDRPNVVGDWQLDHPTAEQWFNTERVRRQRAVHVRQCAEEPDSRTGLLQSRHLDAKSFRLSDGVSADLRFESFNATNAVNLGTPNTTVGDVELRAHLVGGRGQTEPARGQVAFLGPRSTVHSPRFRL